MFKKNYVFIGHQASGSQRVFYKHKLNKQELRQYLSYLYHYYTSTISQFKKNKQIQQ